MVQKSHHVGNFHCNVLAICHCLFPAILARGSLHQGLQFSPHSTRLLSLSMAGWLPRSDPSLSIWLCPWLPASQCLFLPRPITYPSVCIRGRGHPRVACRDGIPELPAPRYHHLNLPPPPPHSSAGETRPGEEKGLKGHPGCSLSV